MEMRKYQLGVLLLVSEEYQGMLLQKHVEFEKMLLLTKPLNADCLLMFSSGALYFDKYVNYVKYSIPLVPV